MFCKRLHFGIVKYLSFYNSSWTWKIWYNFFSNSAHNILLSSKISLTTHNYLPSLKSACPITYVNQKCGSLLLNSIKHWHEPLFMKLHCCCCCHPQMCAVFMVYLGGHCCYLWGNINISWNISYYKLLLVQSSKLAFSIWTKEQGKIWFSWCKIWQKFAQFLGKNSSKWMSR